MTGDPPKLGPTAADRVMADMADQMLIGQANRYYEAGEWTTARTLFASVCERNPPIAETHAVPLGLAHCRIELGEPPNPVPAVVPTGGQAEAARVIRLSHRAVELCRDGAFARAAALLRLIGRFDPSIGETYRIAIDPGPTACAQLAADDAEPRFVRACGVTDPMVAAARERHRGTRALLLTHHYSTTRGYEIANNLVRSAAAFGLEVREAPVPLPGQPGADLYATELLQQIAAFKPALIVFEEFVFKGFSADGDLLADQLRTLLRTARDSLGVRVVRCDADSWYAAAYAADQLYAGIGEYLDLIQHHHVALLDEVPAALKDAVFCSPFPTILPIPDAAAVAVPRGCFAGSIHAAGISRLVWWAESGARALPIDFHVATQTRAQQMSDLDYVRLLGRHGFALNFTRRATGVRTMTARTIEVPLCGGVLVEENSGDTPYFLAPGSHYARFETLDDLAAVADRLLSDEPRRRRMAADAQAWVSRYYAGDYFWTGILARLWG
jgi:hypothetical protein